MRLERAGATNIDKLTEELRAAFPALVRDPTGAREARYRLTVYPDRVVLDIDDALNLQQDAVAAVLAAHDPALKTQAQQDAEARAQIEQTTRAEIDARLGQFNAALNTVKDDWGTLTAGQKADALRALLLITAYVARWLLARALR